MTLQVVELTGLFQGISVPPLRLGLHWHVLPSYL